MKVAMDADTQFVHRVLNIVLRFQTAFHELTGQIVFADAIAFYAQAKKDGRALDIPWERSSFLPMLKGFLRSYPELTVPFTDNEALLLSDVRTVFVPRLDDPAARQRYTEWLTGSLIRNGGRRTGV